MENQKIMDNESSIIFKDIQKQKNEWRKKVGLFRILEVENKYGTRW